MSELCPDATRDAGVGGGLMLQHEEGGGVGECVWALRDEVIHSDSGLLKKSRCA